MKIREKRLFWRTVAEDKKKKKAKTISDFDEKDIFLLNKIDDRKIERERERKT